MDVKPIQIIKSVAMGCTYTALGFGVGCLAGKIVKGPVLVTGAIYAASTAASYALNHLVKYLANKQNWKLSTYNFSKALIGAALTIAGAVSCFALGIFGPVGLGVAVGAGLIIPALQLGGGLYARFQHKDISYKEALAIAEKESSKLSPKQAKEKIFYSYATA